MEILFAFTILPAWAVGAFFLKHDRGPIEPKSGLRSAILFGLLAIVLALVFSGIAGYFLNAAGIVEDNSSNTFDFIVSIATYASVEEVVKFIPLALYVYHKPYFNENTDGIIYFSFVGLVFGGIESLLYAIVSDGGGVFVAIARLVLGFFFHAALTSFVGYFLVHAKITKQGMYKVLLALIFACAMHTLYNYGAGTIAERPSAIFITAGTGLFMNILMFWIYYIATEEDLSAGLAGDQYKLRRMQMQAPHPTQYQAPSPSQQQSPGQPHNSQNPWSS